METSYRNRLVIMKWKIFYDDGSTFSNEDGEPHEAPALGVQCIVQSNEDIGRYILDGENYYYYENTDWERCDLFGLWDYLCRPHPNKVVRFGRNMTTPAWRAIHKLAADDPDFPRKSASYRDERKK